MSSRFNHPYDYVVRECVFTSSLLVDGVFARKRRRAVRAAWLNTGDVVVGLEDVAGQSSILVLDASGAVCAGQPRISERVRGVLLKQLGFH